MRLVAVGLVLALAGFAVADSKRKEKPVEYAAVSGDIWKVDLPQGEPKHEPKNIATPAGVIHVHTVRAEVGRDLVVSVTHATYPERFRDLDPRTILDGVRDGFKGKDSKVTETDLPADAIGRGATGREFRVEAGNRNVIRCRAFWVENRLFQVMAAGSKDAVGGPVADHHPEPDRPTACPFRLIG
jgi:hypothetical protein